MICYFKLLAANKIRNKHNELQERNTDVHCNSPRTDSKSCMSTQKTLKTETQRIVSKK